jgi:hypothetical protein
MISTLSDTELERENIVSKILCKSLLPKDYIQLILDLSSLPIIDTSEVLPIYYSEILKLSVDNVGLLKDNITKDFYYGKNTYLLELLIALYNKINMLIPVYDIKVKEMFEASLLSIESKLPAGGYDGMVEAIQSSEIYDQYMKNYNDVKVQLQQSSAKLSQIFHKFGTGTSKIVIKNKEVKFDKEYQLYLQTLYRDIDSFTSDANLAVTIGKVLDSIAAVNPTYSLDPYLKDLEDNLLKVLCDPKSFYRECKLGEIINQGIGSLFYNCYPQFYKKFYSMYLDEYEHLSFQEQIRFRQGFGIPADNSSLIQFCASTMIAQPQGA